MLKMYKIVIQAMMGYARADDGGLPAGDRCDVWQK